jgi:hypothetical protein
MKKRSTTVAQRELRLLAPAGIMIPCLLTHRIFPSVFRDLCARYGEIFPRLRPAAGQCCRLGDMKNTERLGQERRNGEGSSGCQNLRSWGILSRRIHVRQGCLPCGGVVKLQKCPTMTRMFMIIQAVSGINHDHPKSQVIETTPVKCFALRGRCSKKGGPKMKVYP